MNKKDAFEYFKKVYGGMWSGGVFHMICPEQELRKDFEECWSQLRSAKERDWFSVNQCYDKENGKCVVYFHVLNTKNDSYYDYTLDEWRKLSRYEQAKYMIHNCIY